MFDGFRIAGWSEEKNSNLCGLIHIGDQLIQIGDVELTGMHQLPALFYSQSIPGTPVKFRLIKAYVKDLG